MFTTPIYDVKGIDAAIKQLGFRMRRLQSFNEPLRLLRDDFFELQKGWMDSQGRGSWKPLSEKYAKWKMKKVGNKPILQFSGHMYDDMTGGSTGGVKITNTSLSIRAAKTGRLWTYHQHGTSDGNPSGHARPVRAVLSPALRIRQNRWNKILRDWAAGVAVEKGRG